MEVSRMTPAERPMPDRRETMRQRVTISGEKVYVDCGLYEDGTIGEVFIVPQSNLGL